jgi:dihydropyrimidinase/allantoinase
MDATYDLLITGGTVVTAEGRLAATIAVRDGSIAGILGPGERPAARQHLDATGLHVLPGAIDPHVHTRHPGHPGREDFESGTRAAAAGGVTTLLEMPISKIAVNSGDAVRRRVAEMQPQAVVDFGLYGGAGQESLDDIAGQADAGVVAFKTFLQPPPPHRLDEFRGLWCTEASVLREVMAQVARTGRRHAFHCEYAPLYQGLQARLEAAGRVDGPAHAESRPPIVEEVSVSMVLALAAEANGGVHVVHLSSPRSAELIIDAVVRGQDVTCETCPHYLFLDRAALATHGGYAKCNPPLREPADVDLLWTHVREGAIDIIGSDHSPFLDEEKALGAESIFKAPPGLCGLELMLPLMLTAAREGRVSLERVVELTSQRAAEIFGLRRKGRIAPGADADMVLADLDTYWTFDHERAFTRSRGNMRVFDGTRLGARVVSTFVRGVRVFHEGAVTGSPSHGRFVRPE